MSTSSNNGQGHEELTQVKLLRQNLLNIFLTFDTESSIGHHEVDAFSVGVFENKLSESFNVIFFEDVSVAFATVYSVMWFECFG
jgi:hypothetical protein